MSGEPLPAELLDRANKELKVHNLMDAQSPDIYLAASGPIRTFWDTAVHIVDLSGATPVETDYPGVPHRRDQPKICRRVSAKMDRQQLLWCRARWRKARLRDPALLRLRLGLGARISLPSGAVINSWSVYRPEDITPSSSGLLLGLVVIPGFNPIR